MQLMHFIACSYKIDENNILHVVMHVVIKKMKIIWGKNTVFFIIQGKNSVFFIL